MRHILLTILSVVLALSTARAADPTVTNYTVAQCQGSLRPYTAPEREYAYADSLVPVYISHVGRHGSRYPASATHSVTLLRALHKADSAGSITPLGRKLMALTQRVVDESHSRWGALDSLGMAEQRGIASRMLANFPAVFNNATVNALSSYSPRSMMSMFSFVHQLDRLNNKIEFVTSTGRQNSELMRPFDVNADYRQFIADGLWRDPYDAYYIATMPTAPAEKVLGKDFAYDGADAREMSLIEYYVLAGLSAMSVKANPLDYFTAEEWNKAWSVFNLRQYLQRAASTLSAVPAEIASKLVLDIISRTDGFIDGTNPASADLRFGHAETLFPLLSLLRVKGSYYLTNYFDTVGLHWMDFANVPMAANVQMILFKSKKGNYYVRFDLNEVPIALIPNDERVMLPWGVARDYMMRCVPMYFQ